MLEQAVEDPSLPSAARREAWLHLAAMAEHDGDTARAAACFRSAALG
jgi:HemY protein